MGSPVDAVADVVEIPGDAGQGDGVLIIAHLLQDLGGGGGTDAGMGKTVFGKADDAQGVIPHLEIGLHFFIFTDLFKCEFQVKTSFGPEDRGIQGYCIIEIPWRKGRFCKFPEKPVKVPTFTSLQRRAKLWKKTIFPFSAMRPCGKGI